MGSLFDKQVSACKYKTLAQLDRYRKLCLWLPVPIIRKWEPWGYYIDPNNPKWAMPDEKALACFIKAKEYLKGHSYQVVAEWLESCGYPIGAWGLQKLFQDRPCWPELKLPIEERMKL